MSLAAIPGQVSPPEFELTEAPAHQAAAAEAVALPVLSSGDAPLLGPGAAAVADAVGLDLLDVLAAEHGTGAVGEVVSLPVPTGVAGNPALRRVLLVGVGEGSATDLRRAGAALGRRVAGRQVVATTVPAVDAAGLAPFVAGLTLGSFRYRWRDGDDDPVARVVVAGQAGDAAELDRAVAVARAGWRSRTLATVPSNVKNPAWLADQAEQLAEQAGLEFRVWDEAQLAADGFGGILGVGQASATPPRLIRLDYRPPKSRRAATVVLVGKGITFDTGGLSIKPAESMASMKRDMTGGAVVMAAMAALGAVGCPVRVVGLVPAAENAISGTALRPGDVLRHYGGRTTEVTDTDAEGRLVMADALAYAVDQLKPDALVDVATLTGGIKVALGQQVGGLFATSDGLAEALLAAGEAAGEPLWRFPLHAGYEPLIGSSIADAVNLGKGPAAITAALFLRHFTGDVPWAHLDVASVGDVPEDRHEWTKGPSGFGARALLAWLGADEPLAGVGGGPKRSTKGSR